MNEALKSYSEYYPEPEYIPLDPNARDLIASIERDLQENLRIRQTRVSIKSRVYSFEERIIGTLSLGRALLTSVILTLSIPGDHQSNQILGETNLQKNSAGYSSNHQTDFSWEKFLTPPTSTATPLAKPSPYYGYPWAVSPREFDKYHIID